MHNRSSSGRRSSRVDGDGTSSTRRRWRKTGPKRGTKRSWPSRTRALRMKEVKEFKGTRSPLRHPLPLLARMSHRCKCCRQTLCPTDHFFTSNLGKNHGGHCGVAIADWFLDLRPRKGVSGGPGVNCRTLRLPSPRLNRKDELASAVSNGAETAKVTSSLYQSCDRLRRNFDSRTTEKMRH